MRCFAAWVASLLLLLTICGTALSTDFSPSEVKAMAKGVQTNMQAARATLKGTLDRLMEHSDLPDESDGQYQAVLDKVMHDPDIVRYRRLIEEDNAHLHPSTRPDDYQKGTYWTNYYDHRVKVQVQAKQKNAQQIARAAWEEVNALRNDDAFSDLPNVQFSYILAREAARLELIQPQYYHKAILAAARQAASKWFLPKPNGITVRTISATHDAIHNPYYNHYNNFLALVARFSHEYRAEVKKLKETLPDEPSLPPKFVELKAHLGRYRYFGRYLDAIEHEINRPIDQTVHDPYDLSKAKKRDGTPLLPTIPHHIRGEDIKNLHDDPNEVKASMEQQGMSRPVFPAVYQDGTRRRRGSERYALPRDERPLSLGRSQGKAPTWSNQPQYPTEPANPIYPPQISAYGGPSYVPKLEEHRNDALNAGLNTIPGDIDMGVAPHVKEEPAHEHGYPIAGSTYPYPGAARYGSSMYGDSGSGTRLKRTPRRAMKGSSSNAGVVDGEGR